MRRKSHPFTLLEILIALSLLGLVLGTLFFSLKQVLQKNIAGQALKQKILHLELFRKRLHDLLIEADAVYSEPNSGCISLMFLESEEEEGSSLESPRRMGSLYRKGNLLFLHWEDKEEALLDHVTEFTWKFCDRKGHWSPQCNANANPVTLLITVEIQKDPFSYAFFLGQANDPIKYTHRDSKFGGFACSGAPGLLPAKQPLSKGNRGDAAGSKDGDAGVGKTPNVELRCVYRERAKI